MTNFLDQVGDGSLDPAGACLLVPVVVHSRDLAAACLQGPGGGLFSGPGGGLFTGPGGGLFTGPGGGLFTGPGGGLFTGPGGGLFAGPGGGLFTGPANPPYRSIIPPWHVFVSYLDRHGLHAYANMIRQHFAAARLTL